MALLRRKSTMRGYELDGVPTQFGDLLVLGSEVPPGAGSHRNGLNPGSSLVFPAVLLPGFGVGVIGDPLLES
jgi:hypothetical protein